MTDATTKPPSSTSPLNNKQLSEGNNTAWATAAKQKLPVIMEHMEEYSTQLHKLSGLLWTFISSVTSLDVASKRSAHNTKLPNVEGVTEMISICSWVTLLVLEQARPCVQYYKARSDI